MCVPKILYSTIEFYAKLDDPSLLKITALYTHFLSKINPTISRKKSI